MRPLLLLIIALALTPTVYAAQEVDRDRNYYYCENRDIFKSRCEKLEKGDVLTYMTALQVVRYCDKDELIIDNGTDQYKRPSYTCIYNGKEIKDPIRLGKN